MRGNEEVISNKSDRALAQRLCTFLFENSTAIQSNDRQLKENHYVSDIICVGPVG